MDINMNQGNRPPSSHMMNMNPVQQKIIPSGSIPNVPPHQFQRQQYLSMPLDQHQIRQNQPQHMNNPTKPPQQGQRQPLYTNPPGDGGTPYDNLKRKFDKQILEYLKRNKYNSTASAFEHESTTSSKILSPEDVNELGFLFTIWCNFWDLFGDLQIRGSNIDPTRQYRNDMKGYYYAPSNIRQPPGNSNGHMMPTNPNNMMRTNGYPPTTIRTVPKGPPPPPPSSSSFNIPHGTNVYMTETKHDQYGRAPMQMNQLMGQDQVPPPSMPMSRQPPQKFLPQQNPPPPNRTMMMNPPTPQGGYQQPPHTPQQPLTPQQQQQRYYPNQMMNSPSLSNPPTPNNDSPGNIYSPMSTQSSQQPRTSPQDLSSQTRRTKAKETKSKTAKVTSKKTRSKTTKETKDQKSRTSSQQSSPIQELPYSQQQGYQQQGNYMESMYSPYSSNQNEYIGENYNNPSPYGTQGDMDDITIENQQPSLKKHKSSEIMESPTNLNGMKNMNQDLNYLNEVNDRDLENQTFIMNSLENSNDILANFDNETRSPLSEYLKLETPPEEGVCKLTCSSFNITGELIASGTSRSNIFVWDIESRRIKYKLNSTAYNISGLCFSPNNKTLLISCSIDGSIELWNCSDEILTMNESKCIKTFNSKDNGPVYSVDFHPFNENIFCSSDSSGILRIWDLNKDNCIISIKEAATKQARYSPSGNKIATGIFNTIKIYDANTYTLINEICDHSKHIQSIYWGENDDTLISASEDCVKVWKFNGNQLECIGSFTGNKNYYAIPHPLYMDTQAIIGSYQYMYVWDYSQNRQMNHHTEIHAHNGIISSLCSFGQAKLASTSHDSCVKIWNFES